MISVKKYKDKTYAFRVSSSDLKQIKAKAKRSKRTTTDYIIDCALGKDIVVIDGIEPLVHELKGIGRNLNQLTTLANMGKVTTLRLDNVQENFANIYVALRHLTEEVK